MALKSCRGAGTGAFSFVQVENDIDLDYIKQILEETKLRTEGKSFIEMRASLATSSTNIEDEMILAHEEITKIEKELKSLLTVAEFLLESQDELKTQLDKEVSLVEEATQNSTTFRMRNEQLLEDLTKYSSKLEKSQAQALMLEKQMLEEKDKNVSLKANNEALTKKYESARNELYELSMKTQEGTDLAESQRKEFESRLAENEAKIIELMEKLSQVQSQNDEKDLEISRLRRENEDTASKNKSSNAKVVEYQATNERLRKDKAAVEEQLAELQKQYELQRLMNAGQSMAKDDSSEDSDDEKLRVKKSDLEELDDDRPKQSEAVKNGGGGAGLDLGDNDEFYGTGARQNEFSEIRDIEELNGSFQNAFEGNHEEFSPEQDFDGRRMSMAGGQRLSLFQNARASVVVDVKAVSPQKPVQEIPKVETCEQDTQTENLIELTEKKIQTDDAPRQITLSQQTDKVDSKSVHLQIGPSQSELAEFEIQTDSLIEVEVQTNVLSLEIIKEAALQIEPIEENKELPIGGVRKQTKSKMKPKIGLLITTNEDDESQPLSQDDISQKQLPSTDKAQSTKIFDNLTPVTSQTTEMENLKTQATPTSKNSFSMNQDYQANRDPLKEFFALTLQSVKLCSPHMNIICMLNKDTLYDKAIKENVPFFKWYSWIEQTINKEVLSKIIKDKKTSSPDPKKKAEAKPTTDKAAATNSSSGQSAKEKKKAELKAEETTASEIKPTDIVVPKPPATTKKANTKANPFAMFK
ncbi:hypothetical protein FGO68_gene10009 [Halteria grandinella]|uniref:Uncharacterized protein n=1 Tax=Halteria grandinella TaxID=5974 RepID=A0A8J8T663_HALGN|nr:hypothetical protein FGO68_gene10009 [Halteria grandinella]